ncbi:hypothetical protein LTR56_002897 [Elasticomyces elasticus]|nr:hypothetical protein LTR56_002897 [Elasticomyces elasticus]KAK4930684.1 hypothetical protein LTR49_002771 [Elasticomyces elasticus]KAK5759907.1 hypothetical protein LTS12_009954 [Elasticomyces elasticus]
MSPTTSPTLMSLPEELILEILSITVELTDRQTKQDWTRPESTNSYRAWRTTTLVNRTYHRIANEAFINHYWHSMDLSDNIGKGRSLWPSAVIDFPIRNLRLVLYGLERKELESAGAILLDILAECPNLRALNVGMFTEQPSNHTAQFEKELWDRLRLWQGTVMPCGRREVSLHAENSEWCCVRSVTKRAVENMELRKLEEDRSIRAKVKASMWKILRFYMRDRTTLKVVLASWLFWYWLIELSVFDPPYTFPRWWAVPIWFCGMILTDWLLLKRYPFLR